MNANPSWVDYLVLWLMPKLQLLAVAFAIFIVSTDTHAADVCDPLRATLTREAQAVHGLAAPVPMFAAQLRQESSCRADVTAWDQGRGLAQFMDGTSAQIARLYPELGAPDPYSPKWAIRAQVRYDGWIYQRVQGDSACERWAATLKGFNAGPGYVQRAQRRSTTPGVWFGVTEDINAGQSQDNFAASRNYPRRILFVHQPRYASWGPTICMDGQP